MSELPPITITGKRVLMWDKPAKALSKDEWATHGGFEEGPTGGYVPNMSKDDTLRWKATLKGHKKGFPQVDIKKTTRNGVQISIIVNLGTGYTYKGFVPTGGKWASSNTADKGINVHMSMNGGAQLSFEEMTEMTIAIEEAREALLKLEPEA